MTETLDFLERELLVTDAGDVVGLATSLDADTQGVEGATYVWTQPEVRAVLGDAAPLFEAAYGVTANGNWEGSHDPVPGPRRCARSRADTGLDPDEVAGRLATRTGGPRRRAGRATPAGPR